MFEYYTAIIFLMIFALLVLQPCISKSNTLTASHKRLFRWLFSAIIISAFCEWLGNFLQGGGESTRVLHIIVKTVELSVAPSIAFLFSWIIEKKNEKLIWCYLAVHSVIECLSGIFGFVFCVDKNGVYHHAEFYWIYMMAYLLSIVYCVYIVVRNVKKYQYSGIGFFLMIVAFMITGIAVQMWNSELKVDYMTLGIASVMVYIFNLEMIQQTDELTELLNRRGYENCISHMDEKCVVVFFDVDKFKSVNDNYGHAFGDSVLKNVGIAIRKHYAKYGKCFRYGGDEFCAVITRDRENVESMNGKFLASMEKLRKSESRMPSVSIGYAFYDPDNQNIQDVIAEADKMMYEFKAARKEAEKSVCP